MQRYSTLEEAHCRSAWLTIGSFDGVHRGHQSIISSLTERAHAEGQPAVVLTFFPHPAKVLRGLEGPFYLTTPDERDRRMEALGVDAVVRLPFTPELAATPARDFMQTIQDHLDLRVLMVGHDFALGRKREGDLARLTQLGQELGYELRTYDPLQNGQEIISSTRIRQLLQAGDVQSAGELLGRPYRLQGEIVHGTARGRSIGIPTANLAYWDEQILPQKGVYACQAHGKDKSWPAATNIGLRPTFNGHTTLSIEAHLLGFQGDLYGQELRLDFIQRLRGEQKFDSVGQLVEQIQQDIAATHIAVSDR